MKNEIKKYMIYIYILFEIFKKKKKKILMLNCYIPSRIKLSNFILK